MDGPWADVAHTHDLALLEHAQELRLELEGQLSHLVQNASVARRLEHSRPGFGRAGEGTLLVAEQHRLREGGRYRRTVEDDEGARVMRALRMQRACCELLADSRRTFNQHRELRPRETRQESEQPSHARARAAQRTEETF